jgi:flagellar basal body-associated protein FliL
MTQNPPQPTPPSAPPPAEGKNSMAIIALVLGIIALAIAWIPCLNFATPVLAIAAIILGIIGLGKVKTTGSGKGAAIGGIITGIAGIILMIVITAALGAGARWFGEKAEEMYREQTEQLQRDMEDADAPEPPAEPAD